MSSSNRQTPVWKSTTCPSLVLVFCACSHDPLAERWCLGSPCETECDASKCAAIAAMDCEAIYTCNPATGARLLAEPSDPCESVCRRDAGECQQRRVEDFPDYEKTLADLSFHPCRLVSPTSGWRIETGLCQGEELNFTFYTRTGLSGTRRYYDAETGGFAALTEWTDVGRADCSGALSYWPRYVECHNPIVTRTNCGVE